jgi:predicted CoA-binding protein
MNQTPEQILRSAKTVLLIDWPHQGVLRGLINAGLKVYGYSPGRYSEATFEDSEPGKIIFQKLNERPKSVDIVFIYRPEEEHMGIMENHVLPTGAKTIWLQPPVTSSVLKPAAERYAITIIEGVNIADSA